MAKKDEIVVYWSPANLVDVGQTWNMLYKEPEFLFSELNRKRNKKNPSSNKSMLICPAVSGVARNTLVFTVPFTCSYSYSTDQDGKLTIEPLNTPFLQMTQVRDPGLSFGPSVSTPMKLLFFAEEPLIARLSSPHFHEPKHTQYGACVFGEYDIGTWFRPLNWELQLWKNEGVLSFEEGEPAFYVEFKTDKKIVLKRVQLTQDLLHASNECSNSSNFYGRFKPLSERYQRFKETGMRERVLTQLRANVIDAK